VGDTPIYEMLLIAGFAGLVVMAMMGMLHGHGHHGHGEGHGHALDVHSGHAHIDAGHGHVGHAHGHVHHGHAPNVGPHGQHHDNPNADGDHDGAAQTQGGLMAALLWIMPLLSPLNWFSWMLGAGAAGIIAVSIPEPGRAAIAVAGALGFNLFVVKPMWRVIFGFASRPAKNLDGCLMQQVEAVTAFNQRGEGLVRVNIDGQSTDVLARLTSGERAQGASVSRGDRLLIEEVDASTNSCRVSRV
jgi:hypothetical protein